MIKTVKYYKLRNNSTGKFWYGGCNQYYSKPGREFKSQSDLMLRLIASRDSAKFEQHLANKELEIVEYVMKVEVNETPLGALDMDTDYKVARSIIEDSETSMNGKNYILKEFLYSLIKRNILKDICYIVKLTPDIKTRSYSTISSDQIKKSRDSLRLLNIKTRSFREHRGIFAFYNREQALSARMTLSIDNSWDLNEIRKKLSE